VSGDGTSVTLVGAEASRLVTALHTFAAQNVPPFTLVGGLAVMARLERSHRVTTDIDTVTSGAERDDFLEIIGGTGIVAGEGPNEGQRLYIDGVKVDVIPTGELDLDGFDELPSDDALFVLAHYWAMSTSTSMSISDETGVGVACRVALPAALVAMKLHALEGRRGDRAPKIASDTRDIYLLLERFDRDGAVGSGIARGPQPLAPLVEAAVVRQLIDGADRLARQLVIYSAATPQPPDAEALDFMGRRLIAGLPSA
jgi:hypothetical protein